MTRVVVSIALLFVAVATAGCIGTQEDTLVLFRTSYSHAGDRGYYLAPPPDTVHDAPMACSAVVPGGTMEVLCEIARGTGVDQDCAGDRVQVPWTILVRWNGPVPDGGEWSATAYDEDGATVATWHGEETDCIEHMTE